MHASHTGEEEFLMTREERSKFINGYSKVLTSAWADEKFMARLQADPGSVMKEAGVPIPAGVKVNLKTNMGGDGGLDDQIKLYEDGLKSGAVDIYVPAQPQMADGELSDTQLESIAGGSDCCCCCTPCCTCT
jgi:hypothetical protein